MGTIQTTVFCPITFKLHLHIRHDQRRNPIDFGSWGQRSRSSLIWYFVYKTLWARYRLQFLPNHFQTSHAHCWWWEQEPYWFWVTGSKVKVGFCILCIKLCGHNTDYSLTPITFKLQMSVVDDEKRNPIYFGLQGQMSWSTLAPPLRGDATFSVV